MTSAPSLEVDEASTRTNLPEAVAFQRFERDRRLALAFAYNIVPVDYGSGSTFDPRRFLSRNMNK